MSCFISPYEKTGLISVPNKERKPTKINNEIMQFIDTCMEGNDETTSRDLVKAIFDNFKVKVSETTAERARRKLGWLCTGTKYCQLVREANRHKRLKFANDCQKRKETFDDVIFTDESTVAMESHARISFHRWWDPPRLKGHPKHPLKIHIWAGISRRGTTKVAIFF